MTERLIFSVFVSSPDSMEKWRGKSVMRLICSYWERGCCKVLTRSIIMSCTLGLAQSDSWLSNERRASRAHSSSMLNSGTIRAETNLRWSAMTTTWSMNLSTNHRPSTICGAIYFPLEVLKRSLIRSVKKSSPSFR